MPSDSDTYIWIFQITLDANSMVQLKNHVQNAYKHRLSRYATFLVIDKTHVVICVFMTKLYCSVPNKCHHILSIPSIAGIVVSVLYKNYFP